MPLFEIEQYEIHVQTYRVLADSEAAAIASLRDGEAEPVDGGSEYCGICEIDRLPVPAHLAPASELRSLGMPVVEHIIPSIRSIRRIE